MIPMDDAAKHYGRGGLHDRILDALRADGRDLDHLTEADLAPVDEFHSRGKSASLELLEASGLAPGMRVLDVGSGIGGPARRLARHGLKVVGLDLTPEFVEIARDLTARSGLSDSAEFRVGSALSMPFGDGEFDGVWLQHVNMNIADKATLFAEIARVLRPGGKLACHEIVQGSGGEPILPAPWATSPDRSFVAPHDAFRGHIEGAGLDVTFEKDDTSKSIAFLDAIFERKVTEAPPNIGLHLLFGPDTRTYLFNVARSMKEDRCRVVQLVATKR